MGRKLGKKKNQNKTALYYPYIISKVLTPIIMTTVARAGKYGKG